MPREAIWRVRNLGKATLTFTVFHQRCVVKLVFLVQVRLPFVLSILQSPSWRSHFLNMLATASSPCRRNVSLLLKLVSVSNGIQGHCCDTMLLFRLTLLRLGNVAPISVCLNARPKMGPGAARLHCPLCICLLLLRCRLLLVQLLLTFTARLPTTNTTFNKTQLWWAYGQVRRGKPHCHWNCLQRSLSKVSAPSLFFLGSSTGLPSSPFRDYPITTKMHWSCQCLFCRFKNFSPETLVTFLLRLFSHQSRSMPSLRYFGSPRTRAIHTWTTKQRITSVIQKSSTILIIFLVFRWSPVSSTFLRRAWNQVSTEIYRPWLLFFMRSLFLFFASLPFSSHNVACLANLKEQFCHSVYKECAVVDGTFVPALIWSVLQVHFCWILSGLFVHMY